MSLIMILNKIQSPEDLSEVSNISAENMNDILENSPQQVIDILVSVIRTLCKRIHAAPKEAEELVEKVRSGNMGYLFENMEPMDIQAERKKTAEVRAELQKMNESLDSAKEELRSTKEELGSTKGELDSTKKELSDAKSMLSQKEAKILELENMLKKHNIGE